MLSLVRLGEGNSDAKRFGFSTKIAAKAQSVIWRWRGMCAAAKPPSRALFSELKGRQVQPSREQQYHLLPDYQYPTPRGRQWHQVNGIGSHWIILKNSRQMTTLTLVTILTCVVKHIEFLPKVIFECFTMDLILFI